MKGVQLNVDRVKVEVKDMSVTTGTFVCCGELVKGRRLVNDPQKQISEKSICK